jgi:hypothetical protein
VNLAFEESIAAKTVEIERTLADARREGKVTIYLSTPVSTRGGSHIAVNMKAANDAADRITERLGASAAFVLNPAAFDLADIGDQRAGQGDYMLLWANIVGGRTGMAELLDAVYFMGPSDYATYFHLSGKSDLVTLGASFDEEIARNKKFADDVARGKLSRETFIRYYGLRASTAFSAGANDEWNVVNRVNNLRRITKEGYGVGEQLAILSGSGTPELGDYDDAAPSGNESSVCEGTG